jgi:hypothetical protein
LEVIKGGAHSVVKKNDLLICSSDDGNEDGGVMLTGLSLLIGKRVISTRNNENFLELTLNFNDALSFQMRCRAEGMAGYFLLHKEDTVAIIGGTPSVA